MIRKMKKLNAIREETKQSYIREVSDHRQMQFVYRTTTMLNLGYRPNRLWSEGTGVQSSVRVMKRSSAILGMERSK